MSTPTIHPSPDLRSSLRLAAIAALAVLGLVACRPPEPTTTYGGGTAAAGPAGTEEGLRVRLEVEGDAVGPAPVTVHVLDGSQGVSGAEVEVQGDMSHAGMQPVIVVAAESEAGVYRAEGFAFTMAGDWFVTATVETADGREASEETFVTVRGR